MDYEQDEQEEQFEEQAAEPQAEDMEIDEDDAPYLCWRSLMIISRCQLDQKIMRVCISYTHPCPIKSINHALPFRICKLCFQANM